MPNNYYLKQGETPDQYRQRHAALFALKDPAPVTNTPTSTPTIASLYGSLNQNDQFVNQSTDYYRGIAETPVDFNRVREDVMKALQSEIDATNRVYAEKLTQVRQQGQGRLGSDSAIQARRGLIGSDFGAAQTQNVQGLNNEIEGGVLAEQQAAIAAITNEGLAMAKQEYADKNAARQQGAEAYVTFLNESEKRRTARTGDAVQRALAAGVDLRTLQPDQLKAIAESYQISPDALFKSFSDLKAQEEAAAAEAEAQAARDALDADVKRSTIAKNGRIELGEGSAVYDAQGNRIAYNPKTYKPDPKDAPLPGTPGNPSPFVAQSAYSRLTAKQKSQADSLNNLVRTLKQYKDSVNTYNGKSGVNLFGEDSALLETKLNSIIFAAAQAEGTGALQQADRQVIEKIIPNPTSLSGAFSAATKGGKKGQIAKIEDQIKKYTQNLAGYGLQPVSEQALNGIDFSAYNPASSNAPVISDDEAYEAYLEAVGR